MEPFITSSEKHNDWGFLNGCCVSSNVTSPSMLVWVNVEVFIPGVYNGSDYTR